MHREKTTKPFLKKKASSSYAITIYPSDDEKKKGSDFVEYI